MLGAFRMQERGGLKARWPQTRNARGEPVWRTRPNIEPPRLDIVGPAGFDLNPMGGAVGCQGRG